MPNPIDNPELYKSIILAGVASPGQVTISGHDRKSKWDVKQGDGHSGASTTYKGEDLIEITCSFYLVNDPTSDVNEEAQWDDEFAPIIRSTVSGATPVAKDIYHPDLADNEIHSVVKGTIGGKVRDGKGGTTVAVKFQEYSPPKPKGGSPKGSQGWTEKGGKTKDPNKDAKDELARLRAQAQNAT